MKITQVTTTFDEGCCQSLEIRLETAASTTEISLSDGEPEDCNLSRNFSDAWSIKDMLIEAYNAGKSGEPLEVIESEEGGDEEDED